MNLNLTIPIQLFIAMTYCTYLVQMNLGGEYIAEGVPLILGLIITFFFLIKVLNAKFKIRFKTLFLLYLFYFLYITIITLIFIVIDNHSPYRLLFLYQYFPMFTVILMLGNEHLFHIKRELILITIGFFATLSAVFGILQFLGFETGVPIDINRARGLSRSTLNYSSLMFLGFVASNLISKKSLRIVFSLIIFGGVLASQGRSGIFACVAFYIAYMLFSNFKVSNIIFSVLSITLMIFLAYFFLPEDNLKNFEILTERLVIAFDTNDPSNNQRLYSMTKFFDEFRMVGIGAGITGPAAQRFESETLADLIGGIGYESFLLATIVQGGILGLLMMIVLWSTIFLRLSQVKIEIFAYLGGLAFMMLVSQTLETPTINIMVWLLLIVLIASDSKKFKENKKDHNEDPPMWLQILRRKTAG